MDRVLSTFCYGLCVFSLDVLLEFLRNEKIRTKKVLQYFQKNPEIYLNTLKEGIWIPFVGINSIDYVIKLVGYDQPFNDEWEQKFDYEGFNIEIKNGLWFSDTKSFHPFDKDKYVGSDEISYQIETLIGSSYEMTTVYSGFKYEVPSGKYSLSIKGYKRRQRLEFPNVNCGFLFSLDKVNGFEGFNNPREDELYNFNVANM